MAIASKAVQPEGDGGSDSDDSHASMPELVPVPRSQAGRSVSVLEAALQNMPPALPSTRASAHKKPERVLQIDCSRVAGTASIETACASDGPQEVLQSGSKEMFRLSGVAGAAGKRVDALAQMLDGLASPTLKGEPFAESDADALALATEDVEICTIAQKRLRGESLDGDLEGLDDDSSEDADEDDDDDEQGPAKRRKKTADSDKLRQDAPPGAPLAAPASFAVAAAASTFPLESFGRGRGSGRADRRRLRNGVMSAANANTPTEGCGTFGPRFQDLGGMELDQAKKNWTLHSLADIQSNSSEQNRQTAAALLQELRRRRSGSDCVVAAKAPSAGDAKMQRPTFRRRDSTPVGGSEGPCALASGGRVMEECMAGAGRRRLGGGAPRRPLALLSLVDEDKETSKQAVGEASMGKGRSSNLPATAAAAGRAGRAKRVACALDLQEGADDS